MVAQLRGLSSNQLGLPGQLNNNEYPDDGQRQILVFCYYFIPNIKACLLGARDLDNSCQYILKSVLTHSFYLKYNINRQRTLALHLAIYLQCQNPQVPWGRGKFKSICYLIHKFLLCRTVLNEGCLYQEKTVAHSVYFRVFRILLNFTKGKKSNAHYLEKTFKPGKLHMFTQDAILGVKV